MAALWIALFGKDRLKARLGGDWVIWAGGIAFPVVVLSLLLFYGLSLTRNLSVAPGADEMRVRVTGEMWWWRVASPDDNGGEGVHDANDIHTPAGYALEIGLEPHDVNHKVRVAR